ncbi:MAG: hypothetical protein ACRYG7_42265 [Janthinobacterium lividum]
MKTLLLLATCLGWATASYAQTTPTSSAPTSAPSDASGTKNVGTDRADAPQAPGMTTPDGTHNTSLPSTQTRHAAHAQRTKKASSRKQSATQTSPQ